MAHKVKKTPRLIVSKNAFSRFLEKNYGYTDVRQFTTPQKFSSRLNSVLLAKDADGNEIFIKACRYGDMSENEYRCGLELWQQAPEHFAKPLAYYAGKKFSFCSAEFISGDNLFDMQKRGEVLSTVQKKQIIEDIYAIYQAIKRANIVHRDVALKNMLFHNGRVVLIDCQLSTKRDSKKIISVFDNILKVCMWNWGAVPSPDILKWDDTFGFLNSVRAIGSEPEYAQRYNDICAELQANIGKFTYEHPYPSLAELDKAMKTCRFRSIFHPKSKLRARYRLVQALLQCLKDNHPTSRDEG